ncbi:hypothetical protein TA5114_00828 [Cognatishimia activa]|uniref:Uncharacterized protein n=1 Tax=Cognatishimia activa TaxID=1715691 RepID=A0A0P1IN86_9RHOB|nr:hypothetical protein TA5113_02478 [Cognatishimia activa]CUK25038.1 hypothetical protein TA5114_00828 [Cognatishimia activa]
MRGKAYRPIRVGLSFGGSKSALSPYLPNAARLANDLFRGVGSGLWAAPRRCDEADGIGFLVYLVFIEIA